VAITLLKTCAKRKPPNAPKGYQGFERPLLIQDNSLKLLGKFFHSGHFPGIFGPWPGRRETGFFGGAKFLLRKKRRVLNIFNIANFS
jgi:hypothetical protein